MLSEHLTAFCRVAALLSLSLKEYVWGRIWNVPADLSDAPAAGGAGNLPVSSRAGSIPRINSSGEVRQPAHPSADAEGEMSSGLTP